MKYEGIFNRLTSWGVLKNDEIVTVGNAIHHDLLLTIHSKEYLESLNKTEVIRNIVEIPLPPLPSSMIHSHLLTPMKFATQGSLFAAHYALTHRWSINLGGGFHHASFDMGGGFCIFADISLVCKYLIEAGQKKVLVLDLDAHQGNGYERDFLERDDVVVMDVYNPLIYPGDQKAKSKKGIKLVEIRREESKDEDYLRVVNQELRNCLEKWKPSFIVYNAGTDCLHGDPLGQMLLSPSGIEQRDLLVFQIAKEYDLPICMLLSGGYQKSNAEIISQSVKNLFGKLNLREVAKRKSWDVNVQDAAAEMRADL